MSTKQILVETRKLIEQGWTQGVNARNRYKERVAPASPDATCWCLQGGLFRVQHDLGLLYSKLIPAEDAIDATALLRGSNDLVNYNDTPGRTKEEVLQLIDDTINSLEDNV